MKLTERVIEKLECPPGKRDRLVFDDVQRGLAVRITSTGSRSYLAQYSIKRRKYRVPLGAFTAISLAMARDAARAVMGDLAQGKNPAQDRKAAAEAAEREATRDKLTLGKLVAEWQRIHLASRRESYSVEAVRALEKAFPKQWTKPAEAMTRAVVVRTLDGMTKPAMARAVAAYGRACFSWAAKRGTIAGNPFLALPISTSTQKRDRVLTDAEMAAVWKAAEATAAPFGPIVQMLMLTGQRREEVGAMAWDELSADLATWTIPGIRTKNGLPHIVLLPEPARALLTGKARTDGLVFPGEAGKPFGNWSKVKAKLDKDSGVTGWRIHDLRRTMATGLQRLGVRLEVTEACLNHVSGSQSGVVGVYQRHDWLPEKKNAFTAWASHLMAVLEGLTAEGADVVQMKRTA